MEYKAIIVSAVKGMTNFERAAQELTAKVNEHVQEGWIPQGGLAVGNTQSTNEPFMMQAMLKT